MSNEVLERLVEEIVALRRRVAALEIKEQPGKFQELLASADARIGGGLNLGTATGAGAGDIRLSGLFNAGSIANQGSVRAIIGASDIDNTIGASIAALRIVNTQSAAFGRVAEIVFNIGDGRARYRLAGISALYSNYDRTYGLGGHLAFWTKRATAAGVVEAMRIVNAGRVLIGTTSDNGYGALQANGAVWAKSIGANIDFTPADGDIAAQRNLVTYGPRVVFGTGGTHYLYRDGNDIRWTWDGGLSSVKLN